MDEDEPFLKRWSRRKMEAKDGKEAHKITEGEPPAAEPSTPGERAEPPGEGAERASAGAGAQRAASARGEETDFSAIDFEALDFQSDYSRFLAPGVPEAIRNKALRQLWNSSPIFTAADPFQDYQGDFTDAAVAVPMGALKTAYRIGRGFMSEEELALWEELGKGRKSTKIAPEDAPSPPVRIEAESPGRPEVNALLSRLLAELAQPDQAALSAENVRFFVARCGEAIVGCGGLILGDADSAEITALVVAPQARRAGLGKELLAKLEDAGRSEGVRVLRLRAGARQSEALALFRRQGYRERGPFGSYEYEEELGTFLEKWIG